MMYPPTHKPTETTSERQELLRQERRNRRLTRRREARSGEFRSEEFRSEKFPSSEPRMAGLGQQAALSTMLALALMIAGLIAAVVVGPGEAVSWVMTYLIPTLVILGVVVGTIFLVAWEGGKVYDTRYPHKYPHK